MLSILTSAFIFSEAILAIVLERYGLKCPIFTKKNKKKFNTCVLEVWQARLIGKKFVSMQSEIDTKDFTVEELQKLAKNEAVTQEEKDRNKAVFLHFLQIEAMTKSVRDVKMRTNVDTSRDVTLFEAQDRLSMLAALKEDGKIPSEIVNKKGLVLAKPISKDKEEILYFNMEDA